LELLKQPNYSPFTVEEQVVSVWTGTEGKLDDIPVGDVRRFESEFLEFLRHQYKPTLQSIAANNWDDDIIGALNEAVERFKQMFLGKADEVRLNEPVAEPLAGEENRETITRFRDGSTDRPVEK
jgi:F-type H+-transporting ATPase subunit alpha